MRRREAHCSPLAWPIVVHRHCDPLRQQRPLDGRLDLLPLVASQATANPRHVNRCTVLLGELRNTLQWRSLRARGKDETFSYEWFSQEDRQWLQVRDLNRYPILD